MKPSNNLFLLIKSMTMSEKRFFKLYSSSGSGDKIYLKLFDALEKQQQYDEASIKKIFGREAFIKQLTFTKNYLNEHMY